MAGPVRRRRPRLPLQVMFRRAQFLRWRRKVKVREMLSTLLGCCLVVYAGLVVFHALNGFNAGSALKAPAVDLRVTKVCRGEWTFIKEFIDRDSFFGEDLGGVAIDIAGGECH